jgi:hypothetical protein
MPCLRCLGRETLNVVSCGGDCILTNQQAQVRNCPVGLANTSGIVVGDSPIVDSRIKVSKILRNLRQGGAQTAVSLCNLESTVSSLEVHKCPMD